MRWLVIDSATEACSVALFDGDELVAGNFEMLGRGHAERLVPMIAELADKGRAQAIAVNIGPGSFTGIRVGLAAAKALALAWGASLAGYESPALVAAMLRKTGGDEPVAIVTTGGHGEWFVQSFGVAGEPAAPVCSLTPEAAAAGVTARRVGGTQAEALVARRGWGEAHCLWPDAREFALLDRSLLRPDPAPVYGRAPDAKLPVGR